MTRLRRASGAAVTLGRELGRGGEGAVSLVAGAPDLVAKLYLKPPAPAKIDKLRSMAKRASPALLKVAAWPVEVLSDDTGTVRGFLMPKVGAREDVHQLYSPKSRRRAFPGVDFRFVVRAAANISRAFAQVHALGHVIGDVNHGNALVGRDGTVVLIDCDSFQIRDGARQFTCDVGVALFTAPELAGLAFRGLKRTANHDAFGLAVLLFHLLYLGRHPFAGRHVDGEMPIERAIAESRFAYGANADSLGMSRPPGTLPLGAFGAAIAQLFERAFAPPSDIARPTAANWVEALQTLEGELVACDASALHYHRRGDPGGGPGCCWCALEHDTGMRVFTREIANAAAAGAAQFARLWDSILAIPRPEPMQPLQEPGITGMRTTSVDPLGPVPSALCAALLLGLGIAAPIVSGVGGWMVSLGCLSMAGLLIGWRRKHARKQSTAPAPSLYEAQRQLAIAVKRWNAICHDERFEKRLHELNDLKNRLLHLPQEREQGLKQLRMDALKQQRDDFLDSFRIAQAKLRSVTPQDLAKLASWGIETAEDYLRLSPNLGTAISRTTQLEIGQWANERAQEFRLQPHRVDESALIRQYQASLNAREAKLLGTLASGEEDLRQLAESIAAQRAETEAGLAAAKRAVAAATDGQP
jgi:DNA-binding helix-hairpin-helix protein with protein kinase domain